MPANVSLLAFAGDRKGRPYVARSGPCSPETRYKIARLSEWLTIGGGVPGCMHGGGSPDGARLVVRFNTPFDEYVDYARKIMNIEEDVPEP